MTFKNNFLFGNIWKKVWKHETKPTFIQTLKFSQDHQKFYWSPKNSIDFKCETAGLVNIATKFNFFEALIVISWINAMKNPLIFYKPTKVRAIKIIIFLLLYIWAVHEIEVHIYFI